MAGAAAGMAQVATIMGEEAADAGLPATGAASVEPSVGAIAARAPGATDAATASVQQGLEALAKAIRNVVALDGAGAGGDRAGRQPKDQGADAAASAPAVAVPGASAVAGQAADASGAAAVAATLRQAGAATVERTVPVPVHDRHWAQAMAGQVLVLADQRIDSATLRLSPAHLGSVEVHIEMQAQGVNVSFGAEHAETRAALEQALPQLRAAFAGAGLTLGEATVQQQMRQGSQNAQATAQDRGAAADHLEVTPSVIRAIGLVDEYA
jgi:flagellar hook-length control protein FliK